MGVMWYDTEFICYGCGGVILSDVVRYRVYMLWVWCDVVWYRVYMLWV